MEGSNQLARQVAVVPGLAGALATVVLAVGAVLADVTDNGAAETMVGLATILVGLAMVSGFVVGHYLGLALLAVAALVAGGDTRSTAIVIVTLGLCHEIGRFSLDARRPTRFAPGYLSRLGRRAMVVSLAALAAVGLAQLLDPLEPAAAAIPIGLLLASAPLFLRRSVLAMPPKLRSPMPLRLALGAMVAAVAVGAALLGAGARAAVDGGAPSSTATATVVEEEQDEGVVEGLGSAPPEPVGDSQDLLTAAAAGLTLLIVGLLFVALRRPEMAFELDDLHLDIDSRTLGLSNPGQAELDDDDLVIDERAYARLLDELLIDIATETDPARAIRYGYVTVENRLADGGISRRDSETEQELLRRALPALPGDQASFVALTALFETARFGTEPVTEAMRAQAISAVSALKEAIAPPETAEGAP